MIIDIAFLIGLLKSHPVDFGLLYSALPIPPYPNNWLHSVIFFKTF